MKQTSTNIQSEPETSEPLETVQPSSSSSNLQSSPTSGIPNGGPESYDPNSWIYDFDKQGKCSMDIVAGWMAAGKNWELYNDKPEKPRRQTALLNHLRQILIDRGHISRSATSLKETMTDLREKFISTYNEIKYADFVVDPVVDGNITLRGKNNK